MIITKELNSELTIKFNTLNGSMIIIHNGKSITLLAAEMRKIVQEYKKVLNIHKPNLLKIYIELDRKYRFKYNDVEN